MAIHQPPLIGQYIKRIQRKFDPRHYFYGDHLRKCVVGKTAQNNHLHVSTPLKAGVNCFTCHEASNAVVRTLVRGGIKASLQAVKLETYLPDGQDVAGILNHQYAIVLKENIAIDLSPWGQVFGIYPFQTLLPDSPLLKPPSTRTTDPITTASLTLPQFPDAEKFLNIANLFEDAALYLLFFSFDQVVKDRVGTNIFTAKIYIKRYCPRDSNPFDLTRTRPFSMTIQFQAQPDLFSAKLDFETAVNRLEQMDIIRRKRELYEFPQDRASCNTLLTSNWPNIQSFLRRLCNVDWEEG